MTARDKHTEFHPLEPSLEKPPSSPASGSPAGETAGEDREPGQLEDTPTISGDDQVNEQTQHPAPRDEAGISEGSAPEDLSGEERSRRTRYSL
ncbi:MAG: hypothetical protein QOG06_2130 [Gaiellaceae bacterium]|nr:hypothetical protein [Gaiellaceae bacterium]